MCDKHKLRCPVGNRLTQVNKNGALLSRFYYDGDGRRVISVTGSETVLFFGAHFEASTVGNTTTNTNYYFAGTTRVAVRKYIVPQNNLTLTYSIGDHLGSTYFILIFFSFNPLDSFFMK